MLRLYIENDFESKGRKERKIKTKIESIKIMIYVENISLRWNIL